MADGFLQACVEFCWPDIGQPHCALLRTAMISRYGDEAITHHYGIGIGRKQVLDQATEDTPEDLTFA
jgi:hypothetical protein